MDIIVVLIITVVILGLWFGSNYRNLTDTRSHIGADWKALDELLTRRHALAPELVQQYREEERVCLPLGEAVEKCKQAKTRAERAEAETALSKAIGEYFQFMERKDPAKIEDPAYLSFREKFINLEDQLVASLARHNNDVAFFNAQQKVFPTSFFAKQFKFAPHEEFPMEDAFSSHPLKFKATLPTKKRTPVSEVTQPGAEPESAPLEETPKLVEENQELANSNGPAAESATPAEAEEKPVKETKEST